jgi:hypothetical protein
MGNGKKPCPRGKDCPFINELQHKMEYTHLTEAVKDPSKKDSAFPGKGKTVGIGFSGKSQKLGTASGAAAGAGAGQKLGAGAAAGAGQKLGGGLSRLVAAPPRVVSAVVTAVAAKKNPVAVEAKPAASKRPLVVDLTADDDDDEAAPRKRTA